MLRNTLVGVGLAAVVALIGLFTPVFAQSQNTISIPVSTIVRIDPGQSKLLESQSVDADMVGMICDVTAVGENQRSVHPGNNLVIASGNDSVTLVDVERESDIITQASGQLVLGSEITVTLEMGEDGDFSGGMTVDVECQEPTPVSGDVSFDDQCDAVNDSVTVIETEGVTYQTDDQRDANGVGTVLVTATANEGYELTGDSQWSFEFTNEPCEVPTEQVCRDGEVITINSSDRLDSDTAPDSEECQDGEGGEVLSEEVVVTPPAQIANTGVGAAAASVLGSTSVFAGIKSWLKSRRDVVDALNHR